MQEEFLRANVACPVFPPQIVTQPVLEPRCPGSSLPPTAPMPYVVAVGVQGPCLPGHMSPSVQLPVQCGAHRTEGRKERRNSYWLSLES